MASRRITVSEDEGQNQEFRDDKLNGNVGTGGEEKEVEVERKSRMERGWGQGLGIG